MWMTQIDRRGFSGPIEDYMSQTSTSEFFDWNYYFVEKEKAELRIPDKQDHYLALIALKIQHVIEVICDVKKRSELKDLLLKFVFSDDEAVDSVKPKVDPYRPPPMNEDGSAPAGWINIPLPGESGTLTPLDEKWKKTTDSTKAIVAGLFAGAGMPVEGLINGPAPRT